MPGCLDSSSLVRGRHAWTLLDVFSLLSCLLHIESEFCLESNPIAIIDNMQTESTSI